MHLAMQRTRASMHAARASQKRRRFPIRQWLAIREVPHGAQASPGVPADRNERPNGNDDRPALKKHQWQRFPRHIIPALCRGHKHVVAAADDGRGSSNHRGCASTLHAPRRKRDHFAALPLVPRPAPRACLKPSSRARTHTHTHTHTHRMPHFERPVPRSSNFGRGSCSAPNAAPQQRLRPAPRLNATGAESAGSCETCNEGGASDDTNNA